MNDKNVTNVLINKQSIPKQNRIEWIVAIPQILASISAFGVCILAGVNLAYSAIILPQLNSKNSDLKINSEQASWIASLVAITFPFGALLLGPIMDKFGRKKICIFSYFPFILSWILIAGANDVKFIYCGRIFAGVGGGLATVSLVYVSEITHPSFRPMLLGLNSVFVSAGILLTCILGIFCTWRTMALIYIILSLTSAFTILPLPESPQWLVTFNNGTLPINEISKSLHWLYRDESVYDEQYREIIQIRPKENSEIEENWKVVYSQRTVYIPVIILSVLFLLQQFSGGYVVIFYALEVFTNISSNADDVKVPEFIILTLIGVIRFLMSIVSSLISKRIGRKPLLICSGLGMTFCLLGVIANITVFGSYKLDNVSLICLLGYVSFASFGFFVIPWGLVGEMLPVKVRATLSGVLITWAYICMFSIVKIFPSMMETFGIINVLWFFAAISFVAVCFVTLFLPETFGKTLIQIENYFKSNNET